MWNAFTKMKTPSDFSAKLAIEIFKTITGKEEEISRVQVYIGTTNHIVYTPPEQGIILTGKLNNWFDTALNDYTIDPLIKMAMLHYRFEAIHPFTDGNGRQEGYLMSYFYIIKSLLIFR